MHVGDSDPRGEARLGRETEVGTSVSALGTEGPESLGKASLPEPFKRLTPVILTAARGTPAPIQRGDCGDSRL